MSVYSPTSVNDAVSFLSAHPHAHILAGGTDFMVEVNFNHRKPESVLHLGKIPELKTWHHDVSKQVLRIGATMPFAECEKDDFVQHAPALAQAARTVGSPQIRSMASIGGNLGTSSPAGDSLPVLAALDAIIEVVSISGIRQIPILEFLIGPKKNSLQPGEIITAILLSTHNGPQFYAKVGVRNAMVISIASACLAIQDGQPRIALGSVGPTVLRAPIAEQYLANKMLDPMGVTSQACEEFGAMVAEASRPIDDHRSTAQYRRHAIHVMARRLAEKSFLNVS